MSQVHSITPMHKDGVVRCYTHGLPAAHRISQSEKNPGRPYYCCPKSMSDPNRCPFWYWADDPMFKHKPQSSTSIATPSPSPAFPSSSNPRTHNVAPTTPRKRGFQPSLDSPGLTPSQKRTRLMEEAFRGSSPPPPVGTPGRTLTPQTSQKRLDDIKEALSPTKPPNNFQPGIGVDDASPSRPRTTQPSSLTSRGQPSDRLPHESSDTDEDAALWALVTPPSSSLELGSLSDEHGINVGTAHISEGNVNLSDEQSRWRTGDPENPFDDSRRQVTNSTPTIAASTSVRSPTSLSADTISSRISSLSDIPDYVRKLERRVMAAERGNSAKARRISALEEEVGRLRDEKRMLQETLDGSRHSRR